MSSTDISTNESTQGGAEKVVWSTFQNLIRWLNIQFFFKVLLHQLKLKTRSEFQGIILESPFLLINKTGWLLFQIELYEVLLRHSGNLCYTITSSKYDRKFGSLLLSELILKRYKIFKMTQKIEYFDRWPDWWITSNLNFLAKN